MPKTRVTSSRLPLTTLLADVGVGVELDGESYSTESITSGSNSWSSNRQLLRSNTYPELKIKINSGNGSPPWEGSTSPLSTNSSISSAAEPFNLISFFPMRSEDSVGWNWLNEEGRRSVIMNSEDLSGTETDHSSERLENEDKISEIGIGIADVAGQVIDGEDKFGILGLTSGNVANILLEGILGRFLRKLGDFGGERREDYEPEDIEQVCLRYREREEKRNKPNA